MQKEKFESSGGNREFSIHYPDNGDNWQCLRSACHFVNVMDSTSSLYPYYLKSWNCWQVRGFINYQWDWLNRTYTNTKQPEIIEPTFSLFTSPCLSCTICTNDYTAENPSVRKKRKPISFTFLFFVSSWMNPAGLSQRFFKSYTTK